MLKAIEKNKKLIEEIKRQGLQKQWIAKKAGTAPSTLSRIISGVLNPTRHQAEKIAGVLGVHVDEVF